MLEAVGMDARNSVCFFNTKYVCIIFAVFEFLLLVNKVFWFLTCKVGASTSWQTPGVHLSLYLFYSLYFTQIYMAKLILTGTLSMICSVLHITFILGIAIASFYFKLNNFSGNE